MIPCEHCGSEQTVEGSTCPLAIDCPRCKASRGRHCHRPSGHKASHVHASRIRQAEKADKAKGLKI